MTIEQIAQICHNLINKFNAVTRLDLPMEWEDLPDEEKNLYIGGVKYHLNHPFKTAEEAHEYWVRTKLADGWVWGEERSGYAKTHPSLVPFNKLPISEQIKDTLFIHTVNDLQPLLKNEK